VECTSIGPVEFVTYGYAAIVDKDFDPPVDIPDVGKKCFIPRHGIPAVHFVDQTQELQ
jgi:hypothetical protein